MLATLSNGDIVEKVLAVGANGAALNSIPTVGQPRVGVSVSGSVGIASAALIPAGTFSGEVTVQNRHATQTLSLSFTSPATAADLTLAAGVSIRLNFGPTNILYGIGSGTTTTFAAIGA